MSFIREIKRGENTYYQEVENRWINGKTVQKHTRFIGKDKNSPSSIPLERAQFGYIATRLMQGDLSANELMDMVERMGHHVDMKDLERIGLHYDLKKTPFPFHCTGKAPRGIGNLQEMREKIEETPHISEDHQDALRNCQFKGACENMQGSRSVE